MILNCADCELATVYPTPGPDIIDVMYSEAPPENSVGREVFSSKILTSLKRHLIIEPLLQKLSGYTITHRPTLLDIGCASGWIASVARRIGFDTVGLEMNRMLAEYGREAYDLKIIECSIEDFKTSQYFDAVTMFHVLEHIPEPVKALEHIRSFMSNNGVLLLIVPNTKSLGARLFKEKYNWNAPHHVSFFSPKSIVSV